MRLADIARALAAHGLILRGGFHPGPGEDRLAAIGTVVMIGNAGAAMWEAFAPHVDGAPHPLDRWTRRVVDPIAGAFDATATYPFGADAPPFQRWALRAETLHASPLGILIHPEYGLWHAYRAALLFAGTLDLPPRAEGESPCDACAAKPCLSACPVGAFAGDAYDVAACAGRIAAADADCLAMGCHARSACPVGSAWRYPPEQVRFHMAAFRRSVVP
jgi:hypothetical protein